MAGKIFHGNLQRNSEIARLKLPGGNDGDGFRDQPRNSEPPLHEPFARVQLLLGRGQKPLGPTNECSDRAGAGEPFAFAGIQYRAMATQMSVPAIYGGP